MLPKLLVESVSDALARIWMIERMAEDGTICAGAMRNASSLRLSRLRLVSRGRWSKTFARYLMLATQCLGKYSPLIIQV